MKSKRNALSTMLAGEGDESKKEKKSSSKKKKKESVLLMDSDLELSESDPELAGLLEDFDLSGLSDSPKSKDSRKSRKSKKAGEDEFLT